jgi:hypothetical protein
MSELWRVFEIVFKIAINEKSLKSSNQYNHIQWYKIKIGEKSLLILE